MGLADPVPGLARPAGVLGLHPAEAERVAGLPADEVGGQGSKRRSRDSFANWPNNKFVLLALFGATAGQGVVWYTGQFYALFFLTITLKLDWKTAYILVGVSLLIGTPLFIFFGWLSDQIGRKKIILAGCLLGGAHLLPAVQGDDALREPGARALHRDDADHGGGDATARSASFPTPGTEFTDCDKAKDFLTKRGLSFESIAGVAGAEPW